MISLDLFIVVASEQPLPAVAAVAASSSTCMDSNAQITTRAAMAEKMASANGFLAALDQSGGSSPNALKAYGVPDDVRLILA
jgi:hypothetical protein